MPKSRDSSDLDIDMHTAFIVGGQGGKDHGYADSRAGFLAAKPSGRATLVLVVATRHDQSTWLTKCPVPAIRATQVPQILDIRCGETPRLIRMLHG